MLNIYTVELNCNTEARDRVGNRRELESPGPGHLHRLWPGQGCGLGPGEMPRSGGCVQRTLQRRGLDAEQWRSNINITNNVFVTFTLKL